MCCSKYDSKLLFDRMNIYVKNNAITSPVMCAAREKELPNKKLFKFKTKQKLIYAISDVAIKVSVLPIIKLMPKSLCFIIAKNVMERKNIINTGPNLEKKEVLKKVGIKRLVSITKKLLINVPARKYRI